ncbi:hypothetical protein GBA65_10465 [Rubrobacter marinus]|uniref:Copper transporter n=1 Tax=Rubrobacter marinus TaxID=2653852 RepID=A0A6G8PXE6_9ACTN|nr:copper transporter [Rubrobacter marinus]QIN78873.1 hypothetical protein GBA65_10465 [Rubrobacter marinus]
MPDLRYHVVSLISVFLALAIGVLLGIAMADNGLLDEQLRAQVSDIRADLEGQRARLDEKDERIAELEQRAAGDDAMLAGVSEAVISGRLEGTSVALVLGPYADEGTAEALQDALALSGATLTSVTELEPPAPATGGTSTPEEQYAEEAADVIGPYPVTEGLASAGPEIVVFLGGGNPPPEADEETLNALASAEASMFRVWQGANVRIVGAEASGDGRSQVPQYNDLGVPSVDNADRPAGRAALVLLAAGAAADGAYGTKETASDPFPPVPG